MSTRGTVLKVSRLKEALLRGFPGAEILRLRRETRPGLINGYLVWPKSRGKDQLERQKLIYAKLGADLTPGELTDIGLILPVTPDECRAISQE
jgi:hypothetical protein